MTNFSRGGVDHMHGFHADASLRPEYGNIRRNLSVFLGKKSIGNNLFAPTMSLDSRYWRN